MMAVHAMWLRDDRRVRRLEEPEIAACGLIGRELAETVKIRTALLLPRNVDAVTFGRTIWLRRRHDPGEHRELIAHELVHIRQYAEQGRARFLGRYVAEYLRLLVRMRRHRAAYRAIPAEVEARRLAADWVQRRSSAARPPSEPDGG